MSDGDERRLRAIFAAYGWDFTRYADLVALGAAQGSEPLFRLELIGADCASPRLDALHVSSWERFGNSVMQIGNLCALCMIYDISTVYFESEHEFFDIARLASTTGARFIRRSRAELTAREGQILSGRFFNDAYGLFRGTERQIWADRHIVPLLPPKFRADNRDVTEDSVTVHFRAGDVFSASPHPDYGQPPLEYYTWAVEASGAKKVKVVFEDMSNPTIRPFIDHVASMGLEVAVRSSDLESDLALLFNSHSLISGMGSFLWAVHALSPELKRFWHFHWLFDFSPTARPKVVVNRIADARGDYVGRVLDWRWTNSDAQRRLMLDYPRAALARTGVEER